MSEHWRSAPPVPEERSHVDRPNHQSEERVPHVENSGLARHRPGKGDRGRHSVGLTQNLGEAELLDHKREKIGNSQCVDRDAASAFSFE